MTGSRFLAVRPTSNPTSTEGWAAAGGATVGNMLVQSTANQLVPLDMASRSLVIGALGVVGTVVGAAVATPPGQKAGAAIGGVVGMGAAYGIALLPLPMWLKVPAALLAIPTGAYVGARMAA